MDYNKLNQYIVAYKAQFEEINQFEIYKWRAVAHFQEHWDVESKDFPAILEKSLHWTQNLLASGNYLPRAMMKQFAHNEPETTRNAFANLYDENEPLSKRFEDFKNTFKELVDGIPDAKNDYQDDRAITVYLALRYPETYYLYKFGMAKNATELLGYPHQPKRGVFSNITKFYGLCDLVKEVLIKDDALLRMHYKRLDQDVYQDPNHNLLTQDFIYACVNHLTIKKAAIEPSRVNSNQDSISIENLEEIAISLFSTSISEVSFGGGRTDYEARDKRNSAIGSAAELFVFRLEREKIDRHNLKDKLIHTSIEDGDGKGYDIQSVDTNGNILYIEVKATTGIFETPFYVTRNEMLWSAKFPEQYRTYRVFDFDTKTGTGKLKILKGSLAGLCEEPVSYKINLKEK